MVDIDLNQLKRQVGTLTLKMRPNGGPGIFNLVAGAHVFRMFFDGTRAVFKHASPGTGTREVSCDVGSDAEKMLSGQIFVAVTWTPEEIGLNVGILPSGELHSAKGNKPSEQRLYVGRSGQVLEVGSPGVEVKGAHVFVAGQEEVTPPAIELWQDTCEWVERLCSAVDKSDYMNEVALSNASLVTLVSGYEVYLKRRFVELELEGVAASREGLRGKFKNLKEISEETRIWDIADLISFQSWDRAKDAFAAGYGLRIGELGEDGSHVARLKRFAGYRHIIVHRSPMGAMFQPPDLGGQPEFSNVDLVKAARSAFDAFIRSLHSASLQRDGGS